jgi:hypothetical protein
MLNRLSLYILVIVFLLIIAIVVIVMKRQFKPIKMNFTYDKKDEKIYKNDFIDASPGKNPENNKSNGYSVVLVVFPLYDDGKKSVGTLRSTSSILKNVDKMSDEVSQNINYVLKDGTISVRRYFTNDESTTIREDSFKVQIISGTGSYTDKKGTVEVKVNSDGSRDLMIEIVGEY